MLDRSFESIAYMVYSPSSNKKRLPIIAFKALVIFSLILGIGKNAFAGTRPISSNGDYLNDAGVPWTSQGVTAYCDNGLAFSGTGSATTTGVLLNAFSSGTPYGINEVYPFVDANVCGPGHVLTRIWARWLNLGVEVASTTELTHGPDSPPFFTDTTTRIIDFTPDDGETVTGPNVNFTLHAYINPADIGAHFSVNLTLHNIDQNVFLLSAFSPSDIVLLDGFSATSSGNFYFSTTTPIADGNYRLNAQIERSYLGGWLVNPLSGINDEQNHQFIVGSSTFIGNISQNSFTQLQALFGGKTATSTAASLATCNPLSGFDISECAAALFIPSGDYVNSTIVNLRAGVLTRVPWGYFTRVYNIFNASSTAALPSYTTSIQVGPGDDMTPDVETLTFSPGDMIAGGGALLDSIEDPIHGKTARDIFVPMVQLFVAISVIYTIIADIIGSHKRAHEQPAQKTKLR